MDGSVIPATAGPASSKDEGAFDLLDQPWPTAILQQAGREELTVDTPQGLHRLSIIEGTLLSGPVRLTYILETPRLADRLAALHRWGRRHAIRPPMRNPALSPGTLIRRRLLVMTLDALADGCSLRETAMRLFGAEDTARDWNHASDFLKSRIRRLVSHASSLAAGGYRELL